MPEPLGPTTATVRPAGMTNDTSHRMGTSAPGELNDTPRSSTVARSGRSVDVDGATTLLEAGERDGASMPAGCRMGICHTCMVPLVSGTVRDLRTGNEQTSSGKTASDGRVQTCVSAAVGDCVLDV